LSALLVGDMGGIIHIYPAEGRACHCAATTTILIAEGSDTVVMDDRT